MLSELSGSGDPNLRVLSREWRDRDSIRVDEEEPSLSRLNRELCALVSGLICWLFSRKTDRCGLLWDVLPLCTRKVMSENPKKKTKESIPMKARRR